MLFRVLELMEPDIRESLKCIKAQTTLSAHQGNILTKFRHRKRKTEAHKYTEIPAVFAHTIIKRENIVFS